MFETPQVVPVNNRSVTVRGKSVPDARVVIDDDSTVAASREA
jgi:hypothetical protein